MFYGEFPQNEGRSSNDPEDDEAKGEEEVVKPQGKDRCALVVYVRPKDPSMPQPVGIIPISGFLTKVTSFQRFDRVAVVKPVDVVTE